MPRGDNPNSRANLIKNSDLSPRERQEKARMAGKASGKARKEYATLTEALKDQCTPEVKAQIMDVLIKKAKAGNLKAIEMLRDQLGEKPTDKIEIAQVNPETVSSLSEAVLRRREDGANSN